jgi:hypothetical protein
MKERDGTPAFGLHRLKVGQRTGCDAPCLVHPEIYVKQQVKAASDAGRIFADHEFSGFLHQPCARRRRSRRNFLAADGVPRIARPRTARFRRGIR